MLGVSGEIWQCRRFTTMKWRRRSTGTRRNIFFETNAEQHTHFKFQPLLLAMCIVINGSVKNATQQIVHLVSIGIVTSGLSDPISPNGIENEGTRSKIRGGNVVTTTLPAATKFVMELEMREQRPCLEGRDLTVLDNDLGG